MSASVISTGSTKSLTSVLEQIQARGRTFRDFIAKFGECYRSVVSLRELKPLLKLKLFEEYQTETDLLAHKDELTQWVNEAMYPDNLLLETTYKDKFKDKRESLFTGQELNDKENIMK
jgi:hypothetical protein